jgi:ParB/RepB/Spo0J family partition protein
MDIWVQEGCLHKEDTAMTIPDGERLLFEDLPEYPAENADARVSTKPRLGIRYIGLDQIDDDPKHVRQIPPEDLSGLTESLRAFGQLQSIVVRPSTVAPNKFVVIVGRCRVIAARKAGITTLRALVSDTDKPLVLQLVENLVRHDLHPVDEALAIRSALQGAKSAKDLAQVVGRSTSHISRCLRIAEMDGSVLRALRQKACAFSVANELANPSLSDAQRMTAIALADNKLTSSHITAAAKIGKADNKYRAATQQHLCKRVVKTLNQILDSFRADGTDVERMSAPELVALINETANGTKEA